MERHGASDQMAWPGDDDLEVDVLYAQVTVVERFGLLDFLVHLDAPYAVVDGELWKGFSLDATFEYGPSDDPSEPFAEWLEDRLRFHAESGTPVRFLSAPGRFATLVLHGEDRPLVAAPVPLSSPPEIENG